MVRFIVYLLTRASWPVPALLAVRPFVTQLSDHLLQRVLRCRIAMVGVDLKVIWEMSTNPNEIANDWLT
jgi:hypothetical protein